jgi:C7-cyclitol 7-kinase
MHSVLAINIGGTRIKWAHFDAEPAAQVAAHSRRTPATRQGFRGLLDDLACENSASPDCVSIGFPGPVGLDGRLSLACTWLPEQGLHDFDLKAEVQRVWPRARTSVINDVSAYGRYLLHQGERDFCVLNIGSGIGSKLYADGRELLGPGQRGGEIGHLVDPGIPAALRCDCGGWQHIGAISSGRGVARYARLMAAREPARYARSTLARDVPDARLLHEADLVAHVHDPLVRQWLSEAMTPLARAAALIHLASGCERFFLVGGFAEALAHVLPALLAEGSAQHCWRNGLDWSSAYRVVHGEVSASLIGLYRQGVSHDA